MGGFQPFLRARRANYMTEGLGDVAEAHWQHTKRRLPWGPLPKRSETAQLFLNLLFSFSPFLRPRSQKGLEVKKEEKEEKGGKGEKGEGAKGGKELEKEGQKGNFFLQGTLCRTTSPTPQEKSRKGAYTTEPWHSGSVEQRQAESGP